MGIDFYYLPESQSCQAVLMVAEHLGIELNKKCVDLFACGHLQPEFNKEDLYSSRGKSILWTDAYKMNPQHSVPTIDDNGYILWEGRAILQYLVNKYSPNHPIYPEDPQKRAAIDRMLYFNIGTLFKAERDYRRPQMFQGKPADPEKYEALKKALAVFEEFLGKTKYAAADHITLADFDIIAIFPFMEIIGIDFSGFPKITAWMQKMKKEIPNYEEIIDIPCQEMVQYLMSQGNSFFLN